MGKNLQNFKSCCVTFSVFILRTLGYKPVALNGKIFGEWRIGKNLEGSDRGLM